MKTSFNDIIKTERFLRGEMPVRDALVFQARLLLDADLRNNTVLHRMVHRLVLLYSRKRKKAEVESVHKRLFNDPQKSAFRENIDKLFNA